MTEHEEYLQAIKEWGEAMRRVIESSRKMQTLTSQTMFNTQNLIKELNKRGADIPVAEFKKAVETKVEETKQKNDTN